MFIYQPANLFDMHREQETMGRGTGPVASYVETSKTSRCDSRARRLYVSIYLTWHAQL